MRTTSTVTILTAAVSKARVPRVTTSIFRLPAFRCQSTIASVKPSLNEKAAGRLSQRSLQAAPEALQAEGIFMLEDVVDKRAIESLNNVMQREARILSDRKEDPPFIYNRGNIQQSPPLNNPTLMHPSIFFNPLASHVTSAILGGRPTMSFISGNTAMDVTDLDHAAKQGQPVHSDADFAHPNIPFAMVVNVGLMRMHPKNGSTEIWKGTHIDSGLHVQEGAHGERASGRIKREVLEERAKLSAPFQPDVPHGALLIRDLRLWHAGRPNYTPDPRVMLAMIHFAPWYRQRMSVDIQTNCKEVVQQAGRDLGIPVIWKDHVDHLAGSFGNAFDFDQDP